MSSPLESRQLPIGVVSADAIEQLDPFVPDSAAVFGLGTELLDAESVADVSKARKPATRDLAGSNRFQVVLTALPLIAIDIITLLACLSMGAIATKLILGGIHSATLPSQFLVIVAGYFFFGVFHGLFPGSGISPVVELRHSVISVWSAFSLLIVLNLSFGVLSRTECVVGSVGVILATAFVPFNRMMLRKYLANTSWWGERLMIIGVGSQGRALFRFYTRAADRGLRPIGLVDSASLTEIQRDESMHGLPYLGSIMDFKRLNNRYKCRWAIIAPGGCAAMDMRQSMVQAADVHNLLILPSQFLIPSLWANTRECAGVMGVHLKDHLRNPFALISKRIMDFALAFVALTFLAIPFLFVILWVKWRSPGPAFYGHERIGRAGKKFKAWKFRSMVANADEVLEEHLEKDPEMRRQWIEDQKLKEDPRIIPGIGHFLRKSSLDELPQLWNVLRGDMSLVGPRPIVNNEIDRYREMFPLYLRVRPGITGLWQVSGRNDTSYEQRVRLDSYYVCNWSPWLDTYLIMRTIRTILKREGAY